MNFFFVRESKRGSKRGLGDLGALALLTLGSTGRDHDGSLKGIFYFYFLYPRP